MSAFLHRLFIWNFFFSIVLFQPRFIRDLSATSTAATQNTKEQTRWRAGISFESALEKTIFRAVFHLSGKKVDLRREREKKGFVRRSWVEDFFGFTHLRLTICGAKFWVGFYLEKFSVGKAVPTLSDFRLSVIRGLSP